MSDGVAAERLKGFVERLEKLGEEKQEIADQISDVKKEAKGEGFDLKVLNAILRERKMHAAERQEFQALLDIYRAALGMLDGTPLGDFARHRLMGETKPAKPTNGHADGDDAQTDVEDFATPTAEAEPAKPNVDLPAARKAGEKAAKKGQSIVDNPHAYGDPHRAAWDEGYCSAVGHDGMEIPEAWRRAKPEKPGKGKPA